MRHAIRAAVAALLVASGVAGAQDYEREKRWADEVVPGVVVGDAVWIEAASGRKFLALHAPARDAAAPALLIVHGIGVHPDHGVIGVLRARLNDLGYSTLSIQMPVLAADKRSDAYYPALFPEAHDRIGRATAWLRERHREAKLVLVTHSMGSWMGNTWLDDNASTSPYAAWVCIGLTGGFTWGTYFSGRAILDVYGEEDLPASLDAAARRRLALHTTASPSRQVMIPGADHFYAGKEGELTREIDGWLKEVLVRK